jgi:hypothetical protein
MGCMQTLCWDRTCVKAVLQTGIASHLIDYIQVSHIDVHTYMQTYIHTCMLVLSPVL